MPKRRSRKKVASPIATSSPTSCATFQLDGKESARRDEILDFFDREYKDIIRKYEQEMFKIKMSAVDILDELYTLDILSEEELAKVKILYPQLKYVLKREEQKGPLNQVSGASGCSQLLNSDHILKTSNTENSAMLPPPKNEVKKVTFAVETPCLKSGKSSIFWRKPMLGEKTVSLNGSPLLVAPDPVDAAAHLSLTTSEGKTMVLIPNDENSFSQEDLPELSSQAMDELLKIRKFINNIVVQKERK